MRILFIRHGKPDYKTDTLLEIGKRQAEVVAERVKGEGISKIFASTMGRALETAAPTAKLLGLNIIPCNFMREISWGSESGRELVFGGHPWLTLPEMIKKGESVLYTDWQKREPFLHNDKLHASVKRVTEGADEWLSSLGFERDGEYYRVICDDTDKTVAMFCHGGSSTVFLSHIMNIPFPRMCTIFRPYFTSVTAIELSGKVGELCSPKIKLLSDDRHVPRDDDTGLIEK